MINIDNFIKRLETILDYHGLNASLFADKIGVQRSSLSHLLSGRNKPSLDFILKIIDVFPEVDLYWILKGKGIFPKSEVDYSSQKQLSPPIVTIKSTACVDKMEIEKDLFSEDNFIAETHIKEKPQKLFLDATKIVTDIKSSIEIERIVIFFKNGTFKTYSEE